MWHGDYASGKPTCYSTITKYGFQTKKLSAPKLYDNITISPQVAMEGEPKLWNYYAEHIIGQNYVMTSRDMFKIVTRAKGQNQQSTHPMVDYYHWKYQQNHRNL